MMYDLSASFLNCFVNSARKLYMYVYVYGM